MARPQRTYCARMLRTEATLTETFEVSHGLYCGNATDAADLVNTGGACASHFHFFAGHFQWDTQRLQQVLSVLSLETLAPTIAS